MHRLVYVRPKLINQRILGRFAYCIGSRSFRQVTILYARDLLRGIPPYFCNEAFDLGQAKAGSRKRRLTATLLLQQAMWYNEDEKV